MKKIILFLIKYTVPKEDQELFLKWLQWKLGLITEQQLNMYLILSAEESDV